ILPVASFLVRDLQRCRHRTPETGGLLMNTPPERPQLRRVSANPARSVWAVLRRELGARLLTSGYVWSTVVFAAMAFLGPLLLPATADDNAAPIAVTGDAAHLAPALEAAGIEPRSEEHTSELQSRFDIV